MEIRKIIEVFFAKDEQSLPTEDLKKLKKEYLKEIQGGGCSGCHARRVRTKYEALIIQKING